MTQQPPSKLSHNARRLLAMVKESPQWVYDVRKLSVMYIRSLVVVVTSDNEEPLETGLLLM